MWYLALANNCPGGINEIIKYGVNGEVANIENHKEFSEKIKSILLSQGNYPKENIRDHIYSLFSKDVILEQYVNLLSL